MQMKAMDKIIRELIVIIEKQADIIHANNLMPDDDYVKMMELIGVIKDDLNDTYEPE